MVDQASLNIPSAINTVRVTRKLEKADLKIQRKNRGNGKREQEKNNRENNGGTDESDQTEGIDILV